ncbi:DUF1654 domain-containing protein [Pseudomonas japonica]|uniref:DUF1654 domain-containing protein n=1 Tax=Pseudomonas japonica TaxID=256466 RepID=UPI0015E3AB5E|nr:DUF1654 domain-containing protein [Pseudomonas japonica]MBA1290507.1 DUF1654 domain-containing protein [Pseudomonas japonica]
MRIQQQKETPVASSTSSPAPVTAYEQLALRVQKIINAPPAQRSRSALLFRQPTESPEDWQRLLDEISENDNVTLAWRDDGGIQLFWVVQSDD